MNNDLKNSVLVPLLYCADGARMDARKEDMQCAVSCLGTARVRVQGHLTRAPAAHARKVVQCCSAAGGVWHWPPQ